MMKLAITEYLGWLFQQYKNINDAKPSKYRLINIENDRKNAIVLTIQIATKAVSFTATPQQVLANDDLVDGLSSRDIRTITYYACKDLNKPKNKLAIQRFCERLNRMVFGVKHIDNEQISEKTASAISKDKKLLNSLSQEDAHLVGFTTASEKQAEEDAFKREIIHQYRKQTIQKA